MTDRPVPEETRPSEPAQESDDAPAPRPAGVEPEREEAQGFRADLPLAVLESVRHHDIPEEVLEDEDLATSLPRRLGLTGVVESQIHRYRVARKRRERIPTDDVVDLLKLVMRRPDCEPILREAGHDLARHHHRTPLYRFASLARLLPPAIATRIAESSIRRLMRRIGGGSLDRVVRTPFRVECSDTATARADQYGVACILYGAAIEEAYLHATGHRPDVVHTECEAKGGAGCIWEVV